MLIHVCVLHTFNLTRIQKILRMSASPITHTVFQISFLKNNLYNSYNKYNIACLARMEGVGLYEL